MNVVTALLITLFIAAPARSAPVVEAGATSDSVGPAGERMEELTRRLEEAQEAGDLGEAESLARQVLEASRELHGDEHQEVAGAVRSLGMILWQTGKRAESAEMSVEEVRILRAVYGAESEEHVSALNTLSVLRYHMGDYEGAAAASREVLELRRRLYGQEHTEVAKALNNLATALSKLGRGEEAVESHLEALEVRRAVLGDDHEDVVESLAQLSLILRRLGRLDEAETFARESLETSRRIHDGDSPDVSSSLRCLASIVKARGGLEEAEVLLREALAIDRSLHGAEHADIAAELNMLSAVFQDQGEYSAAEPLAREALAMRRRLSGGEGPYVVTSLGGLARLLHLRGDYAAAEPLYEETIDMQRRIHGHDHQDVAVTLNNYGLCRKARGDLAAAEALFREALEIDRARLGEEHPSYAASLTNLANALHSRDDYAGAERLYREALAIRRSVYGESHPRVAVSLTSLGWVLQAQGDYEEAEELYAEALAMRREILGDEHRSVALSLLDIGYSRMARGDDAGAEATLTEAAEVYERARRRAGVGYAATTSLASPYGALARVRLELGKADEAWVACERSMGRALEGILRASRDRRLTPAEAAREDSLRGELGDAERAHAAFQREATADTTGDSARLAEEARNRLLVVEAEWVAFQEELGRRYPLAQGGAYSLESIRGALQPATAIVGWLDVESREGKKASWGYVVRDRGPVEWRELEATAGRDLSGASFRREIADPASSPIGVARDAADIWRARVRPLLDLLDGVERLVVVPSGEMLGVPLEALADSDGTPLGEIFAISYSPSSSIYVWLGEREARRGAGLALLVGDPPYAPDHLAEMEGPYDLEDSYAAIDAPDPEASIFRSALSGNKDALASLPRLPGTREEIRGISEIVPGATILLGPDASEQSLTDLAGRGSLRDYSTIHLATHALVDDERPERSALVLAQTDLPEPLEAALAGERIHDGLVTGAEIAREWDLDANLVTLSACETGLGREIQGEGYIGLAHAFLEAGARSILVSLWKVEDRATALLMRRFYENVVGTASGVPAGREPESRPVAEALRDAKNWLRSYEDESGERPYEHPYYWSAFVLVGRPD